MKKLIIILLVLFAGGAVAFTLYNNKAEMAAETAHAMKTGEFIFAKVEKVKPENISRSFEANGVFDAYQEVTLMSETNGAVVKILKKKGDYVNKGDLIIQIDDRLIQSELTIATLNLEKSENDFRRFENLAGTDAVTKKQLEESEIGFKIAKAQLAAIQKRAGDTQIKAPISGYINEDFYEPGVLVSIGMPLAHIINKNPLKMTIKVSESEIADVKLGQKIPVRANAIANEEFESEVDFISNKADASFKYEVVLKLKNPKVDKIKPGMFGTANFSTSASKSALVIDRKSLTGGLKDAAVFTVENGVAVKRPIQINPINANQIEVVSGLTEGEEIITSGLINIKEGSKIKAQ
jgi:RND family efflux transporter MFP subunit